MNKVLVVSAHPDDETLGCGGTILKHRQCGDRVDWMIMTNIDKTNGWPKEQVVMRQTEIAKVADLFGFKETHKLDFPTTRLDGIRTHDLILAASEVIRRLEPEVIYLPNRSDIHTDHKIVFQAVMSCTKNFRYPYIRRILMYECLSETEFAPALPENIFMPNVFVDIADFFEKKIEIMNVYKSECMPNPLPRSVDAIESLARYRGSSIGRKYAEAFMLVKEII